MAARQIGASGTSWYVAVVQRQKETLAQIRLHYAGFPAYVPLARKWKRPGVNPEKVRVFQPALLGYLFLGLSGAPERHLGVLRRVGYLRGLLGADGAPVPLCVDALRSFLTDNRFDAPPAQRFMGSGPAFDIGDRVQIMAGPFEGYVVDVRDIRGAEASVLLPLFGGDRTIRLPLVDLEKLAS